jgi:general secretion pathway protein L
MLDRLRHEFSTWITSVAEAIIAVSHRLRVEHQVKLVETNPNCFAMTMKVKPNQPAVPEHCFAMVDDEPDQPLPNDWKAALKASRLDIRLRPQRFMFRPLDLPRQAADFLDGMIRSQIDRLTPWTASEAVFCWSAPIEISSERIQVTVIASPKAKFTPLVRLAEAWRVGSLTVATTGGGESEVPSEIKVFEKRMRGSLDVAPVRRILTIVLLAAAIIAAISYVAADVIGWQLASQQQQISTKISARRAAMRAGPGNARDSAQAMLAQRKQMTPSSVMVLEALSDILPDNTYVTEFRIERDKLQVAGITQDAPSLVNLMEQSPQFARVTFFAPTTRLPNDPGERFHVEARLNPYFGPRP